MSERTNMTIWDQLAQPPQTALKTINAGRLKGKSDINPTWRMQAMTDVFGPVGIGWGYIIDELWTVPGTDGQVFAFARVSVWYTDGDKRSDPVNGIGGHMLIVQESKGLYCNDEAYKMAVTDALSVAFKAIGVAANIYLGMNEDSKYSGGNGSQPQAPAKGKSTEAKVNTSPGGEPVARMKSAVKDLPKDRADAYREQYTKVKDDTAKLTALVDAMEAEAKDNFKDQPPIDNDAMIAAVFDGEIVQEEIF